MNKKRIIIGIIIFILVLGVAVWYFCFKNDTKFSSLILGKNNNLSVVSCGNYNGNDKCLYFKSGNIVIERISKNSQDYEYFIGGTSIGYLNVENIEVIKDDYVLIDKGVITNDFVLYNKDGKVIISEVSENIPITKAEYQDNKLVISGTIIDDKISDICNYKPIDTIVYAKKEVIFASDSITENNIEFKTLDEYHKEHNIDCKAIGLNLSYIYEKNNIKIGKSEDGGYYLNNKLIGHFECQFEVKKQIDSNHVLVDNGCNNDNYVIYNEKGDVVTNFNKMTGINYSCLDVESVIDDLFIIVDSGCVNSNYKIYNKNGKEVVFDGFENMVISSAKMSYKSLILTGSMIDDNVNDVCNYKPLDTIVYLKKSISYSNTLFGDAIVLEQRTLKEYAKEKLNIDC